MHLQHGNEQSPSATTVRDARSPSACVMGTRDVCVTRIDASRWDWIQSTVHAYLLSQFTLATLS